MLLGIIFGNVMQSNVFLNHCSSESLALRSMAAPSGQACKLQQHSTSWPTDVSSGSFTLTVAFQFTNLIPQLH